MAPPVQTPMAKGAPERRRQQTLQQPQDEEFGMDTKWEAIPSVQELATENHELKKEITKLRRQQLSRQTVAGASQIPATESSTGTEPDAADPLGR